MKKRIIAWAVLLSVCAAALGLWIGLDNRTGHTVYLKDRAIPDGEMVTFSVWAVSGLSGLLFDLEPCYIAHYGRYTGRLSLSTNIGEE